MTTIQEKVARLESINSKMRELKQEAEMLKDEIRAELESEGKGYIEIPSADGNYIYKVKTNLRFTKSFDKDGLASRIGVEREQLDYHGVSALVEKQVLNSRMVGEHLTENKSKFITVRRVKAGGRK